MQNAVSYVGCIIMNYVSRVVCTQSSAATVSRQLEQLKAVKAENERQAEKISQLNERCGVNTVDTLARFNSQFDNYH